MLATCPPSLCAELIRTAHRTVALTGAGLSTAAGIPDFRGPQGLYVTRRYNPQLVFEIAGFRRDPRPFYAFSRDFIDIVREVEPTFSHIFLTRLEQQGLLAGVITQNIDMLQQRAGSQKVVELHGSYASAHCLSCSRGYQGLSYVWWDAAMRQSSTPPVARCEVCAGVLKPGIVFFGELVNGYEEAEALVTDCDLLLVLGSTLQVTPASLLPFATDASTVVVNRGEVALPAKTGRYFVAADLDEYFGQVAACLGNV
jgi:NAD-dependent protein deacetylase/lipoamidase